MRSSTQASSTTELVEVETTLRRRARRDLVMIVAAVIGLAVNIGALNAAARVALAPEAAAAVQPTLVAGEAAPVRGM
jgi:hypothetical protein